MRTLRKSAQIAVIPDIGEVQLALSVANGPFAALGNHVQGGASPGHSLVPYTPITSPNITRQASGIFLVLAVVTVSITDSGNLADGDNVTFNLTRFTPGATQLAPVWVRPASTSIGALGVVALLTAGFIDPSGIAQGAQASYALTVTNANGHTSGIMNTTDGSILVLELPG
jgi:hypothetical protein